MENDLDQMEANLNSKFGELDTNIKNMEIGLKWFWKKLIFPFINFIFLKPLDWILSQFDGENSKSGGDDFF